jgi:hypothetical protein
VLGLLVWAIVSAAPARAQSTKPPTIDGTVAGALGTGETLTIHVDAAVIGGFQNVRDVIVTVVSGGSELDHLLFDRVNNQVEVAGQTIAVGTGAIATGTYVRVSAADVILTTGGANLSLSVTADVIKDLPSSTRFRLGVVEVSGEQATVTRELNVGVQKGLTLGTVIAAVVAALLAGGLAGNLVASRRLAEDRPSRS